MLLKILSYIAAVLGAIAALGVIPFVPAEVGGLIVAVAGSLLVGVMAAGDYLDDKVMNKSFKASDYLKAVLDKLLAIFKK